MNFKCGIGSENVKWFKEVISTIKNCVSDVKVEITENGLKLINLDKAHIMFVELDLKPEFFTEFIIDKSTPIIYTATICELYNVLTKHALQEQFDPNTGELFFIQPQSSAYYWRKLNTGQVYQDYIKNRDNNIFWIDTDDLNRIIKRLKRGDTFSLEYDSSTLLINITGKTSKQFTIKEIDIEMEDVPKAPVLDGLSNVLINFESYKEAITDIKMLGGSSKLFFTLTDNGLSLSSTTELGEALIQFDTEPELSEKSVKSCYSLPKIIQAIKGLKQCKTELKIEFSTDTPIRFIYPTPNQDAFLKSLIAPRIEAEAY